MPRWFRLFEKKRGSRRTGSKLAGSVGEALFFGMLFLAGLTALTALLVSLMFHHWPARQFFPEMYYAETECAVVDTRLTPRQEADDRVLYRPEVQVRYRVGEREYTTWIHDGESGFATDEKAQAEKLADFTPDAVFACWYDPDDPSRVILVRSWHLAFWLTILVCVSFLLMGGGGVIYTVLQAGTSAERRSAMARKATDMQWIGQSPQSSKDFPGVPADADLTDSPGTSLAYRLPVTSPLGQSLLAAFVFCLAWNVLMVVFLAVAVGKLIQGEPDWLLTVVAVPTVGVGIWSIYYSFQRLLMATGIGPTSLEIADHPLHPGRQYELWLGQLGQLTIRNFRLRLLCEEEATFRQGTNVRTERICVYDRQLLHRDEVVVRPGTPFECETVLDVPLDCMHSFQSGHNLVSWRLVVDGESTRWGPFVRHFPVVVYPSTVAERET